MHSTQQYSQIPFSANTGTFAHQARPLGYNQNYYKSPFIQNSPAYNYNTVTDPYNQLQQYYNNYYSSYGGNAGNNYYGNGYGQPCYGCQGQSAGGYPNYQYGNCYGCNQSGYSGYNYGLFSNYVYPGYGNKKDCGCGCGGAGDCGQYGFPFSRERLTPKFPEKLRHSYITSGGQVQNKLVINEPTVQSAPFQTQRRKTYQPYTRKYLEYQDYINYIPVQKSEWNYQKVMKQIDFVPQEYYQSEIQYIPKQKVDYKIRYLPVQQQILHVPDQEIKKMGQREHYRQSTLKGTQFRSSNNTIKQASFISQPRINNLLSGGAHFTIPAGQRGPVMGNQSVVRNSPVIQANQQSSLIRQAQSTVQMVPNTKLQPSQFNNPQLYSQGSNSNYVFPQKGGVFIGSSSSQNPAINSFGPRGGIQTLNSGQVLRSELPKINTQNQQRQRQQQNRNQFSNAFRQSSSDQHVNNVESSSQYDNSHNYEYQFRNEKKKSLVDNIEYDYN